MKLKINPSYTKYKILCGSRCCGRPVYYKGVLYYNGISKKIGEQKMKKYRIKYEICQIPSYEYDDEDEPSIHTATIKSKSEEKAKEILERRFYSTFLGAHFIKILKIKEIL